MVGTPEKKSRHDTGIARSVKPDARQASRLRRPRLSPRGTLPLIRAISGVPFGDELVRVVVQIARLGPVGSVGALG